MTISIRTSLGLLMALLLISAGSDAVFAQGTPGAGGAQQSPQMPPGGMNAGAGKKDQFEQGDVKIKGDDESGVGSGEALLAALPYIAVIVVVVVGMGIYFAKSSSAPAGGPAPTADDAADDGGGDDGE